MKKLSVLLIFALLLTLTSCVATKVDPEKVDDVKTNTESPVTPEDSEEEIELPEGMELPWADGPIETPIIPPTFLEDDTDVDASETPETPETPVAPETPVEPTEPEAPQLDSNELPILQIVPEENETPAIPIG